MHDEFGSLHDRTPKWLRWPLYMGAALVAIFFLTAPFHPWIARGQEVPNDTRFIFSNQPIDSILAIDIGKVHVKIRPDGTIVYGDGYDPDETARVFWDAMGRNYPGCK